MGNLYIPKNYSPSLSVKETEMAIKLVKDVFQDYLSSAMLLRRVTAPLFVLKGTGINDDLSGVEKKVTFPVNDLAGREAEVVNSLAKWKRMALAEYDIREGYGIYTDMNAIRPDEELDNIHSLYVDQWDWERVINENERNLDFLKWIVKEIFEVFKRTEFIVYQHYSHIEPKLPAEITFIHAEELLEKYPDVPVKERERLITKEYGAVFIIGIGGAMKNGEKHDDRAPDYDDWSTETINGYKGLNGDMLLWNPVLEDGFEISSMGIRVSADVMEKQLAIAKAESRKSLFWHKRLLNGEFPQSIGGGIGQSRACMYFLNKAHIGEVQASIWSEDMMKTCKENHIALI